MHIGHSLCDAEKDQLESLIDANDLASVLSALSDICSAKAEHIRTHWVQAYTTDAVGNPTIDTATRILARKWDAAAAKLETLERRTSI